MLQLRKPHLVVRTSSTNREQRIMRPPLHNNTIAEHKNLISILHCCQSVRHNKRRSTFEALKRILHLPFGLVVKRTCRFIKNENARINYKGSRNGNSLTLSSR